MAGDFLEIVVKGVIAAGGSNARNTTNIFHFRRTIAGAAEVKANIDGAFQAVVPTAMASALSVRWTQVANTIRYLDDATDPPLSFPHALVGAIAGDSLPMTNTVYFLQKTAKKGKSYRGNKKVGPIAESDTSGGTDDLLNAAALVRWALVASAFGAGFTDANLNSFLPIVVSRKPPSQLLINPVTIVSNDMTSTVVRKSIGRLRKREAKSVY